MIYIYILESQGNSGKYYVGKSENPKKRLIEHNEGKSPATAKYIPWGLKNIIGFKESIKANKFETYLKSGSGRAFAKRHF